MEKYKSNFIQVVFCIILVLISFYVSFNENTNAIESHFVSNFSSFKIQQDDISCGPTCASMILDYYGKFHLYQEIRNEMKTEWFTFKDVKYGLTVPRYMASTLTKHDVNCFVKRGNINVLESYINKNKPVICLVRSGRYTWHYVVVIGYSKNNIYIANPASGILECISKKIFYESWSFYGDLNGESYSYFDSMILLLRTIEVYPNLFLI